MLHFREMLVVGLLSFGTSSPVVGQEATSNDWPLFRGNAAATGVAASTLPTALKTIWKYEVPKGGFAGTAAIVNDCVYLGDLDGHVHALRLNDGTQLWKYEHDVGFETSPAVRDGRLFLGDYSGVFHCFDARSGKPLWTLETDAEINSSANFYQNGVLFGSQDATLYFVDCMTGKMIWKFTIDDQIRCSPTIQDGTGFLAGCDARLHVIDLKRGISLRDVEVDGPTGVTAACQGNMVYFGTEAGTVFGIDWRAGDVIWEYQDESNRLPIRSSPAVADGLVVIGGHNKRIVAIDASSGVRRWTFSAKNRIESSPVIVQDRIYVGGNDGRLYVLQLQTGERLAEYELGGRLVASPAVASHRLVIANDQGTVYCLGGP